MTHVLMTADTVGGVWTYALDLADALAHIGVSVSLATMGRPMDRDQLMAVSSSAVVDVHESSYRLEWMQAPWREVDQAGEWLLRLEETERPDVVHINGYAHGALPWRAPSVVVAHSCVPSWWQAVHGTPAPADWGRYRHRVADGLGRATAVVAPTAAMLEELRRWYGYGGGIVIHNGRRDDWSTPCGKDPMVFGSGRLWDEAKNLAGLRRVAPALPWPVVIAGDHQPPEGAATSAEEEDVSGQEAAHLPGRLPFAALAQWLNRAAVFALPARYEPFGLGALEAGIAGCALVLGDIPSLREVWGGAARYVDPADDASLLAALNDLIADPASLRQLGCRARARALELGIDRCAALYRDLYDRIAVAGAAGLHATVTAASGGRS